ncbi:vitamin K epoxide reductase family protein [Spirosoma oryzicola]|uniref:vitamin K epoxide reductase family protein n=1 Tax=Spirosoma oryzicola TaxID=2898794 RepID=UPI001E65C2AF|nr:vitamin K epoxide reductase family protein [Spirosoma oryzicola]UHG94636.1 cysteine peptidase family C39 domain-containing protein [Spirosoma oryzicola]
MGNPFRVSDDNVINTLYRLLQTLNAKVTRKTLREKILQHPDFPSLLSMSEVLSSWNIDNAALQLHTVEQLREIPLPFVTQLKNKGGWYILVNQIHDEYIQYTDSEQGDITLLISDFEEKWTGIVLLAETDEQSGEVDYNIKRQKERLSSLREPFLLVGILLVLFAILIIGRSSYSASDWLLLFTKISGLFLTGLLTAKELGSKNDLTDRICRINAKTSCENVLNSPAAKLWGWLSWSDLGLLYFAGGLFTLAFIDSQPTIRPLLNGIALIAMPYIIFSIYYQAYYVRQWCVLCLCVQVVFAIEGLLALYQVSNLPNVVQPYCVLLISFLLPTLAWVTIKPLLKKQFQSRRMYEELVALKRNPAIFRTLLIQQQKAPPIPVNLHPIKLGSSDAETKITVVINPYCGSCSKVHKELEQLVLHNQNVGVTFIFSSDSEFNPAAQVAMHLLALVKQGSVAIDALTDWYNQKDKDYNAWVKRFPVEEHQSEQTVTWQAHRQWCHDASIMATPTIYINNYKIPEMYEIENLQWMLSRTESDNVLEVNT